MNKYKVICTACEGSDILTITDHKEVFYENHIPIIAARFRPDMKWGFECQCGNDSRVAPQEREKLDMLVRGGEHSIKKIADNLIKGNENKFVMEKL